jgi:Spy/CpxP family protein refolding chaperone
MNRFLKILGISLVIVGSLNFVNCFRGKKFEDRVNHIAKKMASHLDLDDKQKAELEKIKTQIIEKRAQLKATENPNAKTEFANMVRSDKMELSQLNSLVEPKIKNRKEMIDFINQKIVEFHAILKPEQRKKLGDKLEKFMKHHDDID